MCSLVATSARGGGRLRSLRAGARAVVCARRGELRLVAVGAAGEPDAYLARELELLHQTILMALTSGVHRSLASRPGLDV